MKVLHYVSVFIIAAVLVSCSKGSTGPQGEQGPVGPVAGATTTVYDILPSAWLSNSSGGWVVNLTQTTNPLNGSATILFSSDNVNWQGLPYVANVSGEADINYVITTSNIEIQYVPPTNYSSVPAPSGTDYVQVSIVPAAIQAKYPNINWQNANEVANLSEVKHAIKKYQSIQ